MKLNEIAEIQTGPFGSQLHEEDYVLEGTPIVTVEHLGERTFSEQNLPKVSKRDTERLKKFLLKEGDIVFSRVGSVDRCSFVDKKHSGWMFSGRCLRVRPTDIDPLFLYYFFKLESTKKSVSNMAVGAIMDSINTEIMGNVEINVPMHLQEERVRVLDFIDSKLECNNAIISELEAMAKDIYDYWFVQFDFPDASGRPYRSSGGKMVWNEGLKREIPEGWKATCFGDLFSFVKGKIPEELSETPTDSCSSPYLTIDVANGGNPQYCNPSSMVYCDGQVVMVMDGAASGDVYFGNKGSLGSTFSMLPSKRKDISNALLFMLLQSNKAVYKKANTGSTVPHANRSFIERMKTALPDDTSSFGFSFDQIFEHVLSLRSENRELKSLRDWLLPMLMNGQVKVGGVA